MTNFGMLNPCRKNTDRSWPAGKLRTTQNKSGSQFSGVSEKLQTAVCAGAPTM